MSNAVKTRDELVSELEALHADVAGLDRAESERQRAEEPLRGSEARHLPDHALRAIKDLKPGDHLCCIYETDEEHRAVLTPFLRQGLEQGEKGYRQGVQGCLNPRKMGG